jgi:hypothetical protein
MSSIVDVRRLKVNDAAYFRRYSLTPASQDIAVLVQRFVWVSQTGDWTNPHSNSMGVSSAPYWIKTGKFLLKREGLWGVVNCWGGGFAKFASKM